MRWRLHNIGKIFFLFVIISLLLFTIGYGQSANAEQRNVTAAGKAVISGNITYDQARTQALNQARALAVEQAAGVNVNSVTVLQDSLILTDLVKTFSYGFLINEASLKWQGQWMAAEQSDQLGYPVVEVTLQGTVKVLPRSFFRNYAINAELDKKTYRSGEPVQLKISAKEDVFVLVVNYTSKSNIIPIFPNHHIPENLVKTGQTLYIPKRNSKEMRIIVSNYADHDTDVEAFIVFGFPKNRQTQQVPWEKIFKAGNEIEYAEFFNTLLELPVQWIAEKTVVYTIVKK